MRPISIILLVFAVIAAGAGLFVANRVVKNRASAAAAAQAVAMRDVEVLVAARDIPQGRLVADADVRWERWPTATAEAARVITRRPETETLAHLPGPAVRRTIMTGEPIAATALFTPGLNTGFMSGMVGPGKKAVGVTVTAASTASGFVLPGDLVDVILTVDLRKAEVTLPGGGRFASETILHGVRVLAVDQTLSPGSPGATSGLKSSKRAKRGSAQAKNEEASTAPEDMAMVGKTVALEVTPEQGERLLAAQATGTLSLALRSMALTEGGDEETGFTADVDTSSALRRAVGGGVRVIKGGQVGR